MGEKSCIGVDIGGTSIKYAQVTISGKIVKEWQSPTELAENGSRIPGQVGKEIHSYMARENLLAEDILAIGVGAPGPIDVSGGIVTVAVNLGWKNLNLRSALEEQIGRPVFLINDANAAALGEFWLGAGAGFSNLMLVTLGTGIGMGLVIDGQIVSGAHASAGELGHFSVPNPYAFSCGCGKKGCLETVASAGGLVRVFAAHSPENPLTNAQEIFARAEAGEEKANAVVEEVADYLAYALSAAALTVDPDVILLGGGVSQAGEALLKPLIRHLNPYLFPALREKIVLRIARLGNGAGMIGAAYYAQKNVKKR